MSDQKIASSGAAIFWEVAMDGNLANVDGVEGAARMSATGTPSPIPTLSREIWVNIHTNHFCVYVYLNQI